MRPERRQRLPQPLMSRGHGKAAQNSEEGGELLEVAQRILHWFLRKVR